MRSIFEKFRLKKNESKILGAKENNEEEDDENEKGETFRRLTPKLLDSFEKLREERKKKLKIAESRQMVMHERIVDGEIIYETDMGGDNADDDDDELMYDEYEEKDEHLIEGNPVPLKLGLIPKKLLHKPIIEIDPFIAKRKQSFVILSKRFFKPHIHRFSSTNSLFVFSPFNRFRLFFLWILTWQFFDWFMISTILVNLIILAIPLTDNQSNTADYVFTAVYTIEMLIKVFARGFILKPYTYLRDPWNILDFIILIISYITIILNSVIGGSINSLSALRAFRVMRIFKTVNIIIGLKIVVGAILRALPMFLNVIGIMILLCIIFGLFSLQAYQGTFSQKCVASYKTTTPNVEYDYWIQNEANWYFDTSGSNTWQSCANGSSTNEGRSCPSGYTCLEAIGANPKYGTKNFDNFGFSMMLTFQIFTLDYWDDVYQTVLDTSGEWNVIYFIVLVFAGAFYMVNLTFPVVALAYYTEIKLAALKQEELEKDLVFDLKKLKAKMAEKQKEIEEYNRLHPKNPRSEIMSQLSSENKEMTDEGISAQLTDGQFRDDSDTAKIASIKLSENLGGFNSVVEEGCPTSHFHGQELVADERNCYPCLKLGPFYLKWLKIQDFFYIIVTNIYFELFVAFCIVFNTVVMAIQYHGQPTQIDQLQENTNYAVFCVFVIEAIFKIIAFGKLYFKDLSNWFDLLIIALSIVDFSTPNVNGLTVFRTFRLLRIFKLAKTWKTMSKILKIIASTLPSICYIILVLAVLIFIFAVLGNGLFQSSYENNYSSSEMPYWNFLDVPHSFLILFRVFNGERIQPETECWIANGPLCIVVFYPITIFGNFLLLNMILAVLLSAFDPENLQKFEGKKDERIMNEIQRFKRFFKRICSRCCCFNLLCCKMNPKIEPLNNNNNTSIDNLDLIGNVSQPNVDDFNSFLNKEEAKKRIDDERKRKLFEQKENMKRIQEKNTTKKPKNILHKCFPTFFYKNILKFATNEQNSWHINWSKFRRINLRIVESRLFEAFIMLTIFLSSLSLTFADVNLKNGSYGDDLLKIFDYIFMSIFVIEMFLKWFGLGLKKYFTDAWSLLDFLIVIVSVISVGFEASNSSTNIGFLRVLRALRALRPLRAISRFSGIKTVVNSLIYSIPAIFNVFIVCMIFWLIFSIIGVTLFKGRFYKCVNNSTGIKLSNVANKTICQSTSGAAWYNSKINFDNVAAGFLALFQVATFQGWMEIMQDSVDITEIDQQPQVRGSEWVYIYYIAFILIGSQFILRLIIAVIIDNFNLLKKQFQIGVIDVFLTPNQLKYLQTMNQIGKVRPKKAYNRPNNFVLKYLFDFATSPKFEISITIVIALNMIVNAIEYFYEPLEYMNTISVINTIFVTIYGLESVLKLIALQLQFFRNYWNIFDLIINILSIIYVPLEGYLNSIMVQPNLLRLLRLFRVSQSLRHIKYAKGIRKLLYTIIISLPASINIGILLFLITFIYAIIGMNFFLNVKLINGLTETQCFQTFGKSMVTLFRVSTGAGWNELLAGLSISNSDPGVSCEDGFDIQNLPTSYDPLYVKGCGNFGLAIAFLVTYVIFTRIIILNLFIAVLLENYELANALEENGVTQDDIEMFYSIWEKYDPYSTQFIKIDQLSNFLAELESPLGIAKPNDKAIALFNLPIANTNMIHCLDVLHAVAKHALDEVEEDAEFDEMQERLDLQFLKNFPIRADYCSQTSTLQRKKQDLAARKIQKLVKNWLIKKRIKN